MSLLLLALLLQAPSPEPVPIGDPAPRVLNEVVFAGATAYDAQALREAVRLKTGEPLPRSPEAVARVLESFYRLEGYPAARVSASFEEATGVLTLTVAEGQIGTVTVTGLEGAAEARALKSLGLQPGKPLREPDVWVGLSRLQDEALGALQPEGDPPYTLEEDGPSTRIAVGVKKRPARVYFRGGGPRNSGRYNRVDGFAPGVRLELALSDFKNYNHLRLGVFAAYGFSSHKLRYGVGLTRGVGELQKTTWGYDYHDLTDTDDTFRRYGLEEAPGGIINTQQTVDFFRREGHEAFVYRKLGSRAQVGLIFRSDQYSSLPVTTKDPPIPEDSVDYNPPVEEGRMSSFIASVRLVSRGRLFEGIGPEFKAIFQPSLYGTDWTRQPETLRLDATYEVASTGLGGEFEFTRFLGRLRYHEDLSDHLALDGGFLLGLTSGLPPRPKRFALGGLNTLRGFERKQFQGDEMALAVLEATLFPGGAWPAFIGFWDGGTVWKNASADAGWRHDLGLAVRWPPRSRKIFGRVDVAWPIDQTEGRDQGPQVNLRIGIPF
ncbi:MAG TPA: BamA/TamA family outer membrane protein [Vicinamibacteria bacterium]